jgi:protein SCO1
MFKPSFKGEMVKPVSAAPEISMMDQSGNPFQLSAMRGKVILVFFGFTNCVDECPLTMAHIKLALESLGNDAKNVQVVLVSTDPVRDTPQALQDFLGKFDPSYKGIPGTVDELKKIWNDYGVVVEDGGETHSSLTYVIDKRGDLKLTFDPEATPEDIASDLKILLAED